MALSQLQQRRANGSFSANGLLSTGTRMPRQLLIGVILILALLAFEIFNFDTTRFALDSLLGDIRFAGLAWATILAVAFCAIDFAGLARLFTPERGRNEPREIWYLTGAWLLGATMNAIMTWWAVSVVILNNQLGNEVLSREQLIDIVPVFVAVLVWLTRILFIGAITMAGERLLYSHRSEANSLDPKTQPKPIGPKPAAKPPQPKPSYATANARDSQIDLASAPVVTSSQPTRVNRRPPRPVFKGAKRVGANGLRTSSK